MAASVLVPQSTNWYSSAVACTGRTYSACAAYNYVVIYDSGCTRVLAVLRAHSNKVTAVAAVEASDNEVVLSGGRDKVVIAWSVARQSVVRKQKVPGEVAELVACPHDQNKAIVALSSGPCVVWDWARGGTTLHNEALSSPATICKPLRHAAAVLVGCADGSVTALASSSCKQLWHLPPPPALLPARPHSASRSSRSSKVPESKKAAPQLGIEDIAVTTVAMPSASSAGEPAPQAASVALLAVSTRAATIELLAGPLQPRMHDQHAISSGAPGVGRLCTSDTGHTASAPSGSEAEGEGPQRDDAGMHANLSGSAVPPTPLQQPCWVMSLQVPRGPPTAASQVQWTPVCWLPEPPVATQPHSTSVAPATISSDNSGSDSGASTPDRSRGSASAGTVQPWSSWLVAGLPTGGIMLWRVSLDLGRLAACPVATCVGQALRSVPPPPPPPNHSPAKPAPSSSAGSWRSRNESPASSATWHTRPGSPAEAGGGSPEATRSWRQPPQQPQGPHPAATAQQVKVQMPDVHMRMLFTLHATREAAVGGHAQWRVATTSYDRKIVSWLLQLDAPALSARLRPEVTWHGTGSQISAICSVPEQGTLYMATADKTIRCFKCNARSAGTSCNSEAAGSSSPSALDSPTLQLASRTSSLFHQGFPADVTALACHEALLAGGCADGSVGLLCASLAASKARFAPFASKHSAAVRQCLIRAAGAPSTTAQIQKDEPAGDEAAGPEADAGHGSTPGSMAAVSETSAATRLEVLELLTVGEDSRLILWRGLPPMAEVHTMLRSQAGASKLSAMATPQDVLTLMASTGGPALHGATCACVIDDVILVGTQQGQVAAISMPCPGEHSINTTLRAPDPQLLQLLQVHGASITAIAVTHTASPAACGGANRAAPVCVAAAANSGAVCLAALSRQQRAGGAMLTVVSTMTEVQKSVTDLVFAECPDVSDGRFVGGDNVVGPPDSGAGTVGSPDAIGIHGQEVICGGAAAAARADRVRVGDTAGKYLLLFACTHSDRVHRWRMALPTPSGACDESSDWHVDATYCGALQGAGGSASPLQLCAVSAAPVLGSSPETGNVASGPSSVLRCAEGPQTWIIAGCADRTVRGWPVTAALAGPLAAEPDEAPGASSNAGAAATPADATSNVIGCRGTQADVAAGQEAAVQPVALGRAKTCGADEPPAGSTARSAAAGGTRVPDLPPVGSVAEQGPGQPGVREGSAAVARSADTPLHTPHVHEAVKSAGKLGAGAPLQDVYRAKAGDEHAHAGADVELAHGPEATALPRNATVRPAAVVDVGRAVPLSGRTHGSGPPKAASTVPSVGHTISRFVGVRASDTSRHRPRATALGAASLMSSYIDDRLQALNDSPGSRSTALPGASCSSSRAAETLAAAAEHSAREPGSESVKVAASARLAAISAAHRAALCLLLQDDVLAALDTVIAADALNADFVAMSAAAGPAVWRAVVALHAARLEACGEIHLAAAYLCSARDFEGAVHAYQRGGLLLEAVALAERHLSPDAALLRSLREQLAAQLLHAGGGAVAARWRAEVVAATGGLSQAIGLVLVSTEGDRGLMHAGMAAEAAGETSFAGELAARAALKAQTTAGQLAGVNKALALDVGMAAVTAAVGTVGTLLELWLLVVLRMGGGESGVTLEHAVRAAAIASQRHIDLLGLAANSRAAMHAVEVVGDAAPSVQSVAALAMDLAQQVADAQAVGGDERMHAPEPSGSVFPCRLHILPALCVSESAEAAAAAVSLADMEPVLSAFAQAVGQSVRACLRVSHHVVGAPLQPTAIRALRERLLRLLRPLQVTAAPQHAAADVAAAAQPPAVFRVASMLVDGALTRMSGDVAASESGALKAEWQAWLLGQLRELQGLQTVPPADREPAGDEAADSIAWVAAIDTFVDTAAEEGPAKMVQEANVLCEAGSAEVCTGAPIVGVSADVLLALESDLGDAASVCASADDDALLGPSSGTHAGGAVHAEAVRLDRGLAKPERGKGGKGRKRAGCGRGAHAAEGLSYEEVVSYQEVVQEFGPQDWARFRREAMGGGSNVAIAQCVGSSGEDEGIVYGQQVVDVGGAEREADVSGLSAGGGTGASPYSEGSDAGGEVDLVVSSWMHALSSHPGV